MTVKGEPKQREESSSQSAYSMIEFADVKEKLTDLPCIVKGRYYGGCKVMLKVWGASFAAFDISAEIDDIEKTWQAALEKSNLGKGKLTLTAILSDENDIKISTAVKEIEYL